MRAEGSRTKPKSAVSSKGSRRRRVNVYPGENPSRVRIELELSVEEATEFVQGARKAKRATSNSLLNVVEEITQMRRKKRERDGYLQPQVPESLRNRFKEISRQGGSGGGAAYLRDLIGSWIDSTTGRRRRDPKSNDRRFLRPPRRYEFRDRGRELIRRAKEGADGERLVRYTFDAGSSKDGLFELASALNVSLSEFFAALMERGCIEWQDDPTPSDALG